MYNLSSEEQGVPCPSLDVTYLEDSISEDQKKINLELLAPVREELPANKDSDSHSSHNEKHRMLPAVQSPF
ncbi:hypothetical protein EB796_017546 [Bugula neritina]|uniref:Uncharacterized protein n=1 Tax=Bugula neritina TaxID=10212 RepID=A0A7J7JEY5_BUGNE|nr:hypothetical protein EB796_017546 [Bugula neritina]